jgi:hypothetical protein
LWTNPFDFTLPIDCVTGGGRSALLWRYLPSLASWRHQQLVDMEDWNWRDSLSQGLKGLTLRPLLFERRNQDLRGKKAESRKRGTSPSLPHRCMIGGAP